MKIKDLFKTYYYVPLVAIITILLMKYVFIIAVIPSGSMEPTIPEDSIVIGLRTKNVERGDIIIFEENENSKYYIKRVIGLPGDKIRFSGEIIYINNEPYNEPYIKTKYNYGEEEYEVPRNNYFVLGDNREQSNDSRRWKYPYINYEQIVSSKLTIIKGVLGTL